MVHTLPCGFKNCCKDADLVPNCHLRSLHRANSVLQIECGLSNKAVSALMKGGLNDGTYKKPCLDWKDRKKAINRHIEKMRGERTRELSPVGNQGVLEKEVMIYLVNKLLEKYP